MVERDPFDWLGHTIEERYDVQAVAGSGGFGVVYRGHHRSLDARVAIKCLKVPQDLALEQRREFERRFTEEGRVLHRLSRASAAIVQALDVGAATSPSGAWTPYLVLEWLDGSPLDSVIAERLRGRQARWTLPDAVRLLTPAAEALAEAHDQRIAHRDVKPANLFVAKVGDRQVLKVLDFGIAKVLHESLSQSEALRVTGHAPRAFTPQYGAPEQFDRRKGATGPWTDVHALALVLVELVLGRPALEGDDVVQLMACALDPNARPTPRALGLELGDDVEAVLTRALAVRPDDRFADARTFWRALLFAMDSGTESSPGRASSPAAAELPTGEFLAALEAHDEPPRLITKTTDGVSAVSVPDAMPVAAARAATTSPAIVDAGPPTNPPPTSRTRTLLARFGPVIAAVGLTLLGYDAFRSRRLDSSPLEHTLEPPTMASAALVSPATSAPDNGATAAIEPPPSSSGTVALPRPAAATSGPKPSPSVSVAAPRPASSTAAEPEADELGPEACGSDCKVHGQCTPKVIGGAIVCRASSDADCKRSYMCTVHGACHARKGLCAALSQADCDASEGCKQTRECLLSRGKCVQERYETDADCRKTPGCTMSGRCTALNNGCIATSEAECKASTSCKSNGFCRIVGTSCAP